MKETGKAKSHVDRQRGISEGVVEGERGRECRVTWTDNGKYLREWLRVKKAGNAKSHVDRQRGISEGVVQGERDREDQESRGQTTGNI